MGNKRILPIPTVLLICAVLAADGVPVFEAAFQSLVKSLKWEGGR